MSETFLIVSGCPVHPRIGAYIATLQRDTRTSVNSIYRGADAASVLHRYGKSTQAELYQLYLEGRGAPANSPGHSTHELRSDAAAYPGVPYGHELAWWQQGWDVNDWDVAKVIGRARQLGWDVFQPYHSGSEFHHLNFRSQPHVKLTSRLYWRLQWARRTYPSVRV